MPELRRRPARAAGVARKLYSFGKGWPRVETAHSRLPNVRSACLSDVCGRAPDTPQLDSPCLHEALPICSREGSRNRRRPKANQTGKKFRVGSKSNISTNRNNVSSGVDRCIHLNAMKKTTITSINRQSIKI